MSGAKFYIGAQILAAIAGVAFVALWQGPWNVQRIVGSVLVLSGLGLVLAARFQLGRSFSLTPQARKLVTHGLYSKIRNPIYVFGAVAIAGLAMILQKPTLWLLLAAIIVLQSVRARREAQVLEAKFGDDYRAYRSRTWF